MNIAEVSNSLLGRNVNLNSSHIGRLRSGARALPKKHDYLLPMCRYLANHMKKEYQLNALQKLTGMESAVLTSADATASFLERWLLEKAHDTSAATGRLISGFSRLSAGSLSLPERKEMNGKAQKYASYLYGNAGKRKAVEQFFLMILNEEKPQMLLLFSDENMAWLYEDPAFVARWTELFTQVLLKGNRVRIIHTVSRDMNEMLEAVTKWIPIYMTGMIEPYCYPRLRDGVFQRTLFIAPSTAAVISSSVHQNTDQMLNLFITDRAAVGALALEYERYFAVCRPLMHVFKSQDAELFRKTADALIAAEGDGCLCCAMPPLFSMPEKLVNDLSEQTGHAALPILWKKSLSLFRRQLKHRSLSLVLLDPGVMQVTQSVFHPPLADIFEIADLSYSHEQYRAHIDHLLKLGKRYKNLKIIFRTDISDKMLLYVKDDAGVIMAKTDKPATAFVIHDRNMTNAFWDYLTKF
ncbi:MAG: hypothetical protein SOR89_06635 [Ndongobacter sp.]|nr:hypothetical protein [Ndongobacter sp.]